MGKKAKKASSLAEEESKKKKKEKKSAKALKAGKKQLSSKPTPLDPAERHEMIATAAYYLAEKHGFDPQMSQQDWQQAEREIDNRLSQKT